MQVQESSPLALRTASPDLVIGWRSVLTVGRAVMPLLLIVISSAPALVACSFTSAGRQHMLERTMQMIEWTGTILTAEHQRSEA